MNYFTRSLCARVWPALAFLLLAGCSTISTYDQAAYANATAAKVDALGLMDQATDDYDNHDKEAALVTNALNKAFEYDRGRPLNQITVQQWEILLSPERDLFGGFLRDWKRKGQLRAVFVAEKKRQVAAGFDQIIGLESGKLKPSDIKP